MQGYTTVQARAGAEFVEKRSRFLSQIAPVGSEAEAAAFLDELRKKHWDASHNCSAYILRANGVQRYSDDGEPQGTAGVPILEVLKREEIVDAMIVVTRYFGGTLLGAGGLVRAYTHAAKLAVDSASLLHMRPCTEFSLRLPYTLYGKLENLMQSMGVRVVESDFGEEVALQAQLVTDRLAAFTKQLSELSAGKLAPAVLRELFAPVDGEG